jgi:hypothetical protein
MAAGRQAADWQRAAASMALIANIHRDSRSGRAFTVDDFNPYRERAGGARPAVDAKVKLKDVKDILLAMKPGGPNLRDRKGG